MFSSTEAISWKKAAELEDIGVYRFQRKISVLPRYSTLDRLKPFVLDSLAQKGIEYKESLHESKAGGRLESRSASDEAKVTVRTILPTEYARADTASPAV